MHPFMDRHASPDLRAADLVGRLTVREKLAQLTGVLPNHLGPAAGPDIRRLNDLLGHGIGSVSMAAVQHQSDAVGLAHFLNAVQRYLVDTTRMGIPALAHHEALSGFMHAQATSFPSPLGLASSFSPGLVQRMGEVAAREMRACGVLQAFAPVMDVARDTRWGRQSESFGEDPHLCTSMSVAAVKGMQGADLLTGICATGKHFVGYGAGEAGRNQAAVTLTQADLQDVFLRPFRAAVAHAGLASVMAGYSELNGEPIAGSKAMLTDLLRGDLGFGGVVVADYDCIEHLASRHLTADSLRQAGVAALAAGLDVELPEPRCFGEPLQALVETGQFDVATVDRAVHRVLRLKFALGLFEAPFTDVAAVGPALRSTDAILLARELAQRSVVVLSNERSLLPLDLATGSIAVIGPQADSVRNLFGPYTPPAFMELLHALADGSATSMAGLGAQGIDNAPAVFATIGGAAHPGVEKLVRDAYPATLSLIEAVRSVASPNSVVSHELGCTVRGESGDGLLRAVEMAGQSDVAILALGDKAGWAYDCTVGEGRDRTTTTLPGRQTELLRAVAATGTPTVVVLFSSLPISLPETDPPIAAVVQAWLPGASGAEPLVEILFGLTEPSGRLPVSIPHTAGQAPIYHYHRSGNGQVRPGPTAQSYTDCPPGPAHVFGHGLSYTTFETGTPLLDLEETTHDGVIVVRCTVTNTGKRSGTEVLQLYARDCIGTSPRPVQELVDFRRVELRPGEARDVVFRLPLMTLGFTRLDGSFATEAGEFEVAVASSSSVVDWVKIDVLKTLEWPAPHTHHTP